MPSDHEVGSILGYLRLDRSDWSNELRLAGAEADKLASHNPNIRIGTNAPSAIAQLAAVAAATRRLQDAQGAEGVAQSRLAELQAAGNVSASKLAAAEEKVQKAHRATAAATIALAAAYDKSDVAARKAAADADNLANKADHAAQSFKMGLIPALLAVAPAAVPIAAVAGGALLGLVPVAATVALGIKGIEKDMKSGALVGTQYAADMTTLQGELSKLQQIAAGGLLQGVGGLAASSGLFGQVNADVQTMSNQLGQIVSGLGPALLQILTDLNPLFVTFGTAVANGASHLEAWAHNSTGVQSFVAYVQAELPDVMRFLGQVVVLFSHLAQGAAPFGGVLLNGINMFVGALDKIPVGVLQAAIPAAVSLYVAIKAYQGVTSIVNGVTNAVTAMGDAFGLSGPKAEAATARQEAAQLQAQAVAAEAAASTAAAEAEKAEATAEASASIAASLEGTSSVLAAEAGASAEAAIEFAAAMRAEAVAAATASEDIAASAAAAAAAADTAGAEASVGWGAMLGPIGALVAGGGLLATMFLHNGQAAQQAAAQVNTYTEAIKADSGAVGENTRQAVVNALTKAGALDQARQLGISLSTVTDAVLGQSGAYRQVNETLSGYVSAGHNAAGTLTSLRIEMQQQKGSLSDAQKARMAEVQAIVNQGAAAEKLQHALQDQNGDVRTSVQNAKDQAAAMKTATGATVAQTTAVQNLENAYKALAGQLSQAQAATQFNQALLTLTSTLQTNKSAIGSHTQAGLADQQQIEATIQALQQKDKIDTTNAHTIATSTAAYRADAQAILDHIAKLDGDKSSADKAKDATYQFALKLLDLGKIKVPPAVLEVVTADALAKVDALQAAILRTKSLAAASPQESANLSKLASLVGSGRLHAAGGIVNSATWVGPHDVAGEAGPEAIVPLRRPLSQVDPSVRGLAAIAQGKQMPDQRPVNVNVYPQAVMDANAVGAAAARWLVAQGI